LTEFEKVAADYPVFRVISLKRGLKAVAK